MTTHVVELKNLDDLKDLAKVDFYGDWAEAAPSVIDTAKDLINKYHPHLRNYGARIGFLFRKEAPIRSGKHTLGQAQKVTDKMKVMLDYDFIIWVAKDVWDRSTTARRMALLDHELCHCVFGSNGWTIRPHDMEEFVEVIDRWGFWTNNLMRVQEIANKQPPLPGMEDKGTVEAVKVAGLNLEGELS